MPLPARTLTAQLVWPVVGLVLIAVLANVAFAAWLATRSAVVTARTGRERIVAALDRSRIALVPAVLDALADLTGSELVVWDDEADTPGATTLAPERLAEATAALRTARDGDVIEIGAARHAVAIVRASGVRPERAVVLTPVDSLATTTWAAAWPVLAVAAATLALLVPLGLATTGRIARRIAVIERRVERISEGEFGVSVAEAGDDEVGRLAAGVERMSGELESLRARLVAGERQRLLGQLAAGFAHELRNAITGARLAIDLHRRRCPGGDTSRRPDDSLTVACRQLDIVEEEVRGLLALGRPPATDPAAVDVDALVAEVRDLVAPRCAHAGVELDVGPSCGTSLVGRREALRAALVNLALNAIDAAGGGGHVSIVAATSGDRLTLAVEDDGPGPPPELGAALAEPFVTGKQEGVGLGLAVARAVAEQHGGTLAWQRADRHTRFTIVLPTATASTRLAPAEPTA
jgi:signal transduction histidine kinase